MNKKTIRNAIILAAVAVVLVVTTVLVTVAYLTSSAVVANTFTVGKVGISMFESKTDEDGNIIEAVPGEKTSKGNNYLLVPGHTYVKDPTIYVNDTSTKAYLFIKVRNDISSIERTDDATNNPTIAQQLAKNGWKEHHVTATDKVYVYTGVEGNIIGGEAAPAQYIGDDYAKTEIPVFEQFSVTNDADVSIYTAARVSIMAYAIQDSPTQFGAFGTAGATTKAWDAIVKAYPYVPEVTND